MSDHHIRLLSWRLYVDPECLAAFERETGIGVEEVTILSDDDCLRHVRSGEAFDVVLNSEYCASVLIREGLVQPLDLARLPNFALVTDPTFRSPPFDPGTGGVKYTTVNFCGTMGFCVHLDRVVHPTNSWRMLFDEAYRGQITMLGDARQVLASALYLLGSDCNCTDRALIDEATEMLVAQRALVSVYTSDEDLGPLLEKGAAIVVCYNGDVALALRNGATGLAFMLPQEGYNLWMDAPLIPANAPYPEAAHLLLDFLMRPEIGAQNGDYSGYLPAIDAAEARLKSLVQRSLRPLDTQIARGVFQRDLGEFNQVYEEAFRKILAS